jgi:hypothetical protein
MADTRLQAVATADVHGLRRARNQFNACLNNVAQEARVLSRLSFLLSGVDVFPMSSPPRRPMVRHTCVLLARCRDLLATVRVFKVLSTSSPNRRCSSRALVAR